MTAIIVPSVFPLRIHRTRWCKNGQAPDAELYSRLRGNLNHCIRYRRKQFASKGGLRVPQGAGLAWLFAESTGAGPVTRWRWRNRTGAAAEKLRFVVEMAKDSRTLQGADPRIRFSVTPAGGATVYTNYIHYGLAAESATDIPDEIAGFLTTIDVDPETIYEIALLTYDEGRPVSCVIEELSQDPDTDNDYYVDPGAAIGAPILTSAREEIALGHGALLRANPGPIWQWTADLNPRTRVNSGTYRNVHDESSTAHSASSAGVTVDLTGRNTRGRATVPCSFDVFANTSSGSAGKVKLINASGDVVAFTTIGTTLQWYSTTVDLAVGSQKLDLMIAATASTTTNLYAMSLYQDDP